MKLGQMILKLLWGIKHIHKCENKDIVSLIVPTKYGKQTNLFYQRLSCNFHMHILVTCM